MNKVIMIGRISKDPKAYTTQGGVSQSTFSIAVNRRFKNKEGKNEADFFAVIAWRGTADFCNKYLQKGRLVSVEGTLQNRTYEAQDGSKRWVTEIIADSIEGLDKAKEEKPAPSAQNDGFTEVEDDELPFD